MSYNNNKVGFFDAFRCPVQNKTNAEAAAIRVIEKERLQTSDGHTFVLSECIGIAATKATPIRRPSQEISHSHNTKRRKKKRGTTLKHRGDYSQQEIFSVFNTLDAEQNGVLSVENIMDGFQRINQSAKINQSVALKMLRYANNDAGSAGAIAKPAFLQLCRKAKLCYE